MKLQNFKLNSKFLYWGLIFTFFALYICVGFVSTLHSITFFHITNGISLAVLLGITYELGQSAVLFSILMTKNRDRLLPWSLMFLLTALQVTANVYASFKYMVSSGSTDWVYWQKSILIGVQAENAEMYQVIISWISGALLPIVALGMTALVAENIKLMSQEDEAEKKPEKPEEPEIDKERIEEIIENEVKKRLDEIYEKDIDVPNIKKTFDEYTKANLIDKTLPHKFPTESGVVKEPIIIDLSNNPEKLINLKTDELIENGPIVESINEPIIKPVDEPVVESVNQTVMQPINKIPGWHFMKEFVDNNHNVFSKGKFIVNDKSKQPTPPKKA